MNVFKKNWKKPDFILDIVQAVIAVGVAIVLALDMTGVLSGLPWLSENIDYLIFILLCVLILSSVLERRVQIEVFTENVNSKLDQILQGSQAGIRLENRQGFNIPLEIRLKNSNDVALLGVSLAGLITTYEGFFVKKANEGCLFRVLISGPNAITGHEENRISSYWQITDGRRQELEYALNKLRSMMEEASNFQVKLIDYLPPFSLLIIDPDNPDGEVQLEIYLHKQSASDRPHIILTQSNDKYWYDFFRNQFELTWRDALPLEIKKTEE